MNQKERLTAIVALKRYEPNSLICEFLYEYGYEVIAVTDYFYDFIEQVLQFEPDLAIFEATLYDSYTEKYFNKIKQNNRKTYVCAICNDQHKVVHDIECFRISALDFSYIDKKVRNSNKPEQDNPKNKLYSRLIEVLAKSNITPTHIGYKYICNAVELVLHDNAMLNKLTSELYPMIASINNTSSKAVERAIRLAVTKADTKVHFSAGEFIGYIVQILQSEFNT